MSVSAEQITNPISVRRISGTFVGEVDGIDMALDHDEHTIAALRAALNEHLILVFHDQRLSNEQHGALIPQCLDACIIT